MEEEDAAAEFACNSSSDKARHPSYLKKEEISERRRQQLREIEVKVVRFQDDLESGAIKRNKNLTLSDEVQRYREKLLQKV
ncbi:unnamed protein product [Soboliphyme baturini]|uniref:Cwf21 domain-containing protein n=1 Tax=Soboliphyme baturini TaxID=241478 RepID=A0A183IF97_9BILA|nr:unnamed protein product [Soboliphyme baturini]